MTAPVTVALDEDGLDVLELALGGALDPGDALVALAIDPGTHGVVLTDAENTPLATVAVAADGRIQLEPGRPFAHATGPQFDPALRRPPSAIRALLGTAGPVPGSGPGARAVVADAPPTRGDLEALGLMAAVETTPMLLVLPLARGGPPSGRPGAASVVRAWSTALADVAWHDRVVPVVVPWPRPAIASRLDLDAVLDVFGAAGSGRLDDLRSEDERERVAGLAGLAGSMERAVRDLYPDCAVGEVLRALDRRERRGAVVFLTGLSGSGKSTIARALATDLEATGNRAVTLLDGDEVRQHLSRGLGFDAASRAINIDRIGYVASLVATHGGIAVAAPIAPFDEGRRAARAMAEPHGPFLLVHVSTPLEVCEARDRKGLYAKARSGEIPEFTGISSPYEAPMDADVTIDTSTTSLDDAVAAIRRVLEERLSLARQA